MDNNEFYNAWYWLWGHPAFHGKFLYCLDIEPVLVNPATRRVEDDESLNTKTEIWLELGPYNSRYATHDIDLDCGGWTFEEAIIKLRDLVEFKYGAYNDIALDIYGEVKGDYSSVNIVKTVKEREDITNKLKEEGKSFYCEVFTYGDDEKTWVVCVKKEEVS